MHLIMHILLLGWLDIFLAVLAIRFYSLYKSGLEKGTEGDNLKKSIKRKSYKQEEYIDYYSPNELFFQKKSSNKGYGESEDDVLRENTISDEKVIVFTPDYTGETIESLEAQLTKDDADVIDDAEFEEFYDLNPFFDIDPAVFYYEEE